MQTPESVLRCSYGLSQQDWLEMNNRAAAATGDRRTALEALRDTLAAKLDTTEAQIHAQLAAQYRATLLELEQVSTGEGVTPADDVARRIATLRLADSDSP